MATPRPDSVREVIWGVAMAPDLHNELDDQLPAALPAM